MAETRVVEGLSPQIWDDQFSTEFFQNNPFAAYAGTENDNPIVMKEDFASKRGNGITFEFITSLKGPAIRGRAPLKGHESQLGEYGDKAEWDMRKNGISIHEMDADLAAIDLRKASRGALKQWADEDVKFEVIQRLQDVGSGLDVAYDSAAAADLNTWNTNNKDRILYGNARSNYSAGAHATSLGNVDTTADTFTKSSVSLLKRMALMAAPRITPVKVSESDNRRVFVAFVHPYAMRDLVASLNESERQVSVQSRNEGLFLGGDREWDGVIVHEVDDMPIYADAGASSADIAPVFLLGQEALGWAIKQRYRTREDEDDYGQIQGLGILGKWGMKKLGYTIGESRSIPDGAGSTTNIIGKQRGVVNGFFAVTGD